MVKRTEFGILLRASRLGYHYSKRHNAYIRISDIHAVIEKDGYKDVYKVDVCDVTYLMPSDRGEYIHWWESKDKDIILNCIPLLFDLERYKTFYIDEDGNEIEWPSNGRPRGRIG